MKVTAMLADHVTEANGKLYMNGGGWNIWWSNQAPFVIPHLGLAVLITVPYTATNQMHTFSVQLTDDDGNLLPLGDAPPEVPTEDGKIRRLEGQFNVGRPPQLPPGEEQNIPIGINMSGVALERFGSYAFVIELDGVEEERLHFRLATAPGVPMRPA